ncbi:Putative ripening-related protein 2 [Linum grandiflorum]
MKNTSFLTIFLTLLLTISTTTFLLEAKPTRSTVQSCKPSGQLRGKKPPPKKCNKQNNSECCVEGKLYPTYKCSPPITQHTKATLTINSFQKGADGGGPSECDDQFHSDKQPIVALSTGWFEDKKRCFQFINITSAKNGKSVLAKVVDECDSSEGCDDDHDYQPPCPNDIVDGSKAVWDALGVPEGNRGDLKVTWSPV